MRHPLDFLAALTGASAPFKARSYPEIRMATARRQGCTCKTVQEMDAWYGTYCPAHRTWPQDAPAGVQAAEPS